jgi:hypothetical protein
MTTTGKKKKKKKAYLFLLFLLGFLFDGLVDIFPDPLELVLSLRTKVDLVQ